MHRIAIPLALLACGVVQAADWMVLNPSSKMEPCGPNALPGCQLVLLQGDPKTAPSQHVYRFPAGTVFPKHWHVSNENLVMTKGTVKIAADGQSEKTITFGDYVHIPAKLVHWGVCLDECEFYTMVDGPDSFNVVEQKRQ